MQRYEKYKDSGVEWIGEIPEGWEVKKFKYLYDLVTDKNLSELGLPKIGLENIESGTGKFIASHSDFEGEGIHFKVNDILFGKLRPYLAKVYLAQFEGKAVGDFYVFRCKDRMEAKYSFNLILSKLFIDLTNSSTFGSKMPRVAWDVVANFEIAYPSVLEQTTIANYLDRKTAEIDQLIAQKERLVALYEEEKTALINQAVTQGINPKATLKESGIDWLGEIPEHWEVKKLKYVLQFHNNKRIPLSAEVRGKMSHKKYDYYGASGIIDSVDDFIFNGEYILLGEDGANLLTRNTALAFKAAGQFWVNNHAHILTPIYGNLDYYVNLLECLDYKNSVSGSAQPKLTLEALGAVDIVCLPFGEQTAIVQHIETETTRINTKITQTKKIIALQKEYRTALISEVVTGKVKVT